MFTREMARCKIMERVLRLLSDSIFIICLQLLLMSKAEDLPEPSLSLSSFPGHLEPLGSSSPKHSLEVIHSFQTPSDFFTNYVAPIRPVLIKGGAKLSPAFSKWTDEYFLSFPEANEFKIVAEQRKKEIRTFPPRDASFTEFVGTYQSEDIYMVNGVPPFLQQDVLLPPPLLCKDIVEDMLVDTVMWFSSGGTKSVLHNDDVDNINCLFSGTKELLFIDYKYKKSVPIDFPAGGYSGVDVDRVDFEKYPSLRDVEFFNVTMETGDCLFIPYKWFHQVRSYDRNIAVNVWWKHIADFIPKDCDLEPNQTIDKFTFSSLEDNGDIEQPLNFIQHLQSYVENGEITFNEFKERFMQDSRIFNDEPFQWNDKFTSIVEKIFQTIDKDEDKTVSVRDIELLEKDTLVESILENELARIEDLIEDQSEEAELEKPTVREEL